MSISQASIVANSSQAEQDAFYASLTKNDFKRLRWDWSFWARPEQLEPEGDWGVWLALAGRGFGKTRLGSEWIRSQVCGPTPLGRSNSGVRRIALVAETAADARDVMVQGPSGILAVHPPEFRPRYVKSDRALYWPNGAMALLFSAEEPDQLRGPEHDIAWSDELAKWRYAQETWDMLQFGLRSGLNPRQLVTTTPRPIPIVRELLSDPDTTITRGSTYDNAPNLASKFIAKIQRKYEGTRLGRQEIGAEVLDDVPGALWTRAILDRRTGQNPNGAGMGPSEPIPEMRRVVVAVDPSGTSGEDEDEGDDIGIVVAGLGIDGQEYILEDATCQLGPAGWAKRVVYMYDKWDADLVVGEKNFGGAMVEHTIRTARRRINYRDVTASRGKVVRAEPVAALYEQGRVRHTGTFAPLEDEMVNMTSDGYMGNGSPNRVDALVWAITELEFGRTTRGGSGAVKGHH
jgi:phage terminase large subunit-like protein